MVFLEKVCSIPSVVRETINAFVIEDSVGQEGRVTLRFRRQFTPKRGVRGHPERQADRHDGD